MLGFGGLSGLRSGNYTPQPEVRTEECRRCRDRKNARALGGFPGLAIGISKVASEEGAEVSAIIRHSADIDRYSKDHIEPDLIDLEDIYIPSIVKDACKGIFEFPQNVKPFEYTSCHIEPQEHIRILKLLTPGDVKNLKLDISEDFLCCKIVSAKPSKFKYEALSYTWGRLPRDIPILILQEKPGDENVTHDLFTLPATPQLFAALCALRKQGTRNLWIDQLCINQEDKVEVAHQMGQMDEIYKRAEHTVIWLGQADEYAPTFNDLVGSFRQRRRDESDDDWVKRNLNIKEGHANTSESAYRVSVTKFLNRQWFSRAWIFQEAVLSTNITMQCGELKLSFDDVIRLVDAVYKVEDSIAGYARSLMKTTVGYNTLDLIRHAKHAGDNTDSPLAKKLKPGNLLEMLLVVLQHLRAFDEKDLINAFLGVVFQHTAKDKRLAAITDKRPAVEVWTAAARHIIETTKSLDILAAASGCSGRANLPSWTPDWSCCFKFASPITPPDFSTHFDASSINDWGGMSNYKFTGKNQLHVRGRIIDTITWFSTYDMAKFYFMLPGSGRTQRILKLKGHVANVREQLSGAVILQTQNPGEDLEHSVLRTLLADGAFGNEQPITVRMHDLVDIYELEDEIEKEDSQNSTDRVLLSKLRQWGLVAQKKGLFLTKKNFIGLAPHKADGGARVGDVIGILCGSKVPCVLRAVDGGYSVICQCYVDGWMYGKNSMYKQEGGAVSELVLV